MKLIGAVGSPQAGHGGSPPAVVGLASARDTARIISRDQNRIPGSPAGTRMVTVTLPPPTTVGSMHGVLASVPPGKRMP